MRKLMLGAVALAAAVITACDPSSTAGVDAEARLSGGTGGGGTPTFLVADAGVANLAPVSFYAKVGSDRMGEVFVNGSSGGNGNRIIRLRVKKDADIILPNGTRLAKGDSVLITMQVMNATTLATHFEPAGIQFKGKNVAQLAMWYDRTNASASASSGSLKIWQQETSTSPWVKLASKVDGVDESVSAYIPGFTNYVIAY